MELELECNIFLSKSKVPCKLGIRYLKYAFE